jgi:hypothetical protein
MALHLFPTELLEPIFRSLRDDELKYIEERFPAEDAIFFPSKNIMEVRLVCRRFYWISSQFLLEGFTVSATSRSMKRLEELSEDPKLSKHIKALEVNLACYAGVYEHESTTQSVVDFIDSALGSVETEYEGINGYRLRLKEFLRVPENDTPFRNSALQTAYRMREELSTLEDELRK